MRGLFNEISCPCRDFAQKAKFRGGILVARTYTAVLRMKRLSEKVHATISKGIVGGTALWAIQKRSLIRRQNPIQLMLLKKRLQISYCDILRMKFFSFLMLKNFFAAI